MNCEGTGLQKRIGDSAEMRQVFCKTSSHISPSHFFSPFYLLCFHSSCLSPGFTAALLTIPLPFHQLLSALGPFPHLLSLQLHFSDASLLLLLLPFAAPILSALYLAFWLFFLAMTQFLPEPYHRFFVSFCPFCAPFTYSTLLPAISNQLPSSSFFSANFCPTLVPQALSFLSCCISLSYFPFLILFPLPTSPPCGPQHCCCTAALSHSHPAGFQGPLAAPGVSVPFLPLSLGLSLLFPLCSRLFPPLASSSPKGRWFRTNAKLQGSSGLESNFHQPDLISTCCFCTF